MQRFVLPVIASALLAVGLAAGPASAATKITLSYTAVGDFVGGFVAKDQGFFDKRGLDVEFSLAPNGSVIPAALVADSAQIGTPTPPVLLQADEQGLDLLVVAGAGVAPFPAGGTGVAAREGSGLKGAPDLVGRKVGTPGFGGTLELLTNNWIKASGADYRKVDWVEVAFPQMGDALKSGLVDAVASVNPFYSRIIDSKVGYEIGDPTAVVPSGTMLVVYAAPRAWVAKNGDAVKVFRAALDEATAYIADLAHTDSVRASLAKYMNLPPQAAASVPITRNLEAHAKPAGLTFWIAVARDQGLIKGNPDPASLIAP